MIFYRDNMFYKDYNWNSTNNDDPWIMGILGNKLLNRKEGNEVLYFINACAKEWGWNKDTTQAKSYQKIERSIRERVPTDIDSQTEIKKWIGQHWREYWNEL